LVAVTTEEDLDPAEPYTVAFSDYQATTVVPGRILDDRELFHSDVELGALYTPGKTVFRLFGPSATAAHVILYDNPTGDSGRTEGAMRPVGPKIWEATVPGDLKGRHYMFRADTRQFGRGSEAWDPYAVNTTGQDGHPRLTDLRETDPEGF